MPIRIPSALPAAKTLRDENIFVMELERATSQDIRPLKILVLNLMPTKIATETQLARLLGNTPLQIEMELIAVSTRTPKHTAKEHMITFYKTFGDIKEEYFALIAPRPSPCLVISPSFSAMPRLPIRQDDDIKKNL